MRIFDKEDLSYSYNATRTLDFGRFSDNGGDIVLVVGYPDYRSLDEIKDKKIVHLEFEEPNRFFSGNPLFHHLAYEDYFYKIFTICPYTAKWLNEKYKNTKRTFVFFPFNEKHIPPRAAKVYDIIYTGHILSRELEENALTISKFNYQLISGQPHPLVTNTRADYDEKIKLISQTKITLVHNILFVNNRHLKNLYENVPDFNGNAAYKLLPANSFWRQILMAKEGLVRKLVYKIMPAKNMVLRKIFVKMLPKEKLAPQIKSRLIEAAFCRSLILCRKDPFNLIELYFEPEKEFVYYEPGKLEQKIREILGNYSAYEPVIERAYARAVKEYTTRSFYEKYLKNLE